MGPVHITTMIGETVSHYRIEKELGGAGEARLVVHLPKGSLWFVVRRQAYSPAASNPVTL